MTSQRRAGPERAVVALAGAPAARAWMRRLEALGAPVPARDPAAQPVHPAAQRARPAAVSGAARARPATPVRVERAAQRVRSVLREAGVRTRAMGLRAMTARQA